MENSYEEDSDQRILLLWADFHTPHTPYVGLDTAFELHGVLYKVPSLASARQGI